MKLDFTKIQPVVEKLNRYKVLLFALIFLGIYAALSLRINEYTNQEPSQQAVTDSLQSVKRITVDKDSIAKLKELEEQNVEVQSLLNEARKNPFSEQRWLITKLSDVSLMGRHDILGPLVWIRCIGENEVRLLTRGLDSHRTVIEYTS